jgi:hypothetical protein
VVTWEALSEGQIPTAELAMGEVGPNAINRGTGLVGFVGDRRWSRGAVSGGDLFLESNGLEGPDQLGGSHIAVGIHAQDYLLSIVVPRLQSSTKILDHDLVGVNLADSY